MKTLRETTKNKSIAHKKLKKIRKEEGKNIISNLPKASRITRQITNIHVFDENFENEKSETCIGERIIFIEVECSETSWYWQILNFALLFKADKFIILGGCCESQESIDERFNNFNLEVIWINPAKEGVKRSELLKCLKRNTFWEDMKNFLRVSEYIT